MGSSSAGSLVGNIAGHSSRGGAVSSAGGGATDTVNKAQNLPLAQGDLPETMQRLRQVLGQAVACDPYLIQVVLAVLLAEGHLLIEDVPGVGKTTLAKALAHAIDCQVGRVQFTPDLLPTDLTGGSIYRANTGEFEFRPGPIFNNIVIADEINRASPKTQSALLEAMEERQATIEGVTYQLPRPFLVVATQNPVELEGTYPLPEAQRDRFLARIEIGYPTATAELDLLDRAPNAIDLIKPVTSAVELAVLITQTEQVHASVAAKQYVLDLVHATRHHRQVRLGASPRAAINLLRTSKAIAAMEGRGFVLPDDIQMVAITVLAHRLILTADARLADITGEDVMADIVRTTPVSSSAHAQTSTHGIVGTHAVPESERTPGWQGANRGQMVSSAQSKPDTAKIRRISTSMLKRAS